MAGISAPNLPSTALLSHFLGLKTEAGQPSMVLGKFDDIAQQLLTSSGFSALFAEIRALAASGTKWANPVVAATTGPVALSSLTAGSSLDGRTLAAGDRVLNKDAAAPAQNGIYVIAASGAPTRATDADEGTELKGLAVFVVGGAVNGGTQWVSQTGDTAIVVGTTALVFRLLSDQKALNAAIAANTAELTAARGVAPATVYASLAARLAAIEAITGPASGLAARFPTVAYVPGVGLAITCLDTTDRMRVLAFWNERGQFIVSAGISASSLPIVPRSKVEGYSKLDVPGFGFLRAYTDTGGYLRAESGQRVTPTGASERIDLTRPWKVADTGGGTTPVAPSVTKQWPSRPNSGWIIEGAIHNQWINLLQQMGDNIYIGAIGEPQLPGKPQSPVLMTEIMLRSSASKTVILGDSYDDDDHDAAFALLDARFYVGGEFVSVFQPADYPVQVLQREHGGKRAGVKLYRSRTSSSEHSGERIKSLPTITNLTYGQPYRDAQTPDRVRNYMRTADDSPRTWSMAVSTDNCATGFQNLYEYFKAASDNMYMMAFPRASGDGDGIVFHNHPASPGSRSLAMLNVRRNGTIWSFKSGDISNPTLGEAATDPWATGDIIYTPTGTKRVRLCDVKEVAAGIFGVAFLEIPDLPNNSDFNTAAYKYLEVDTTGSAIAISAAKTVALSGGGYFARYNAYLGLCSILRRGFVAASNIAEGTPPAPTSGKWHGQSVLSMWDIRGSDPVRVPFKLHTMADGTDFFADRFTSNRAVGRPVTAMKHQFVDGIYSHVLGDAIVVVEVDRYDGYDGPYRSRQRVFEIPEAIRGSSIPTTPGATTE